MKLAFLNSPLLFSFLVIVSSCQKSIDVPAPDSNVPTADMKAILAFPGRHGEIKTTTINGKEVEYEEIDGYAVFEGDIIIPVDKLSMLGKTNGAGRRNLNYRWPDGIVYYTIDPALPNQQRVIDAINAVQNTTPVRFQLRSSQNNYITFRKGDGCASPVGMIGGQQIVTLGDDCGTNSIIHEIGHCLGMWHEQARADRDQYINILWDKIDPTTHRNFKTYIDRGFDGFDHATFDYSSIMMYPPTGLNWNGPIVITKKDGSTYPWQYQNYSTGDIACLYAMYPQMFIIQDNTLFGVERVLGTRYSFGGNWAGTQALSILNGKLYAVQNGTLFQININTGQATQLGNSGAWTGVTAFTSFNGFLYMAVNNDLHKINPATGQILFTDTNWSGTTQLKGEGSWLYTVTNGTLYRADPATFQWLQIGAANQWNDTRYMTSYNGSLYMIQAKGNDFGLYQTNVTTGAGKRLSANTSWNSAKSITVHNGSIYILHGGELCKVNTADGLLKVIGGVGTWPGTIKMAAQN